MANTNINEMANTNTNGMSHKETLIWKGNVCERSQKLIKLVQRGDLNLQEHQERDGHSAPSSPGQPRKTVSTSYLIFHICHQYHQNICGGKILQPRKMQWYS